MFKFKGTFRHLLTYLGVDDDSEMTTVELARLFEEVNGDGMPLYQVWSVNQDKQVLGDLVWHSYMAR